MTLTSPTSPASRRHPLLQLAWIAAFLAGASSLLGQVAPALADRPSPESPPREAVFMGYNLKNYLRMPRQVNGTLVDQAPKPEEEIDAVVALILEGRPDILGLVEMGTEEDLKDLQARLKQKGLDLPHATLNKAFDEDRRTALISRFPLVNIQHRSDLHYSVGTERWAFRRGILDASVRIHADYELRVLGVHFKSKRPQPGLDQALMRRHEAHLTRKHIVSILKEAPETNLLLFGDLNDTRNEAPINAIQGKRGTPGYMEPLRVSDPDGARWTYYWEVADQYSRFDYLFVSRGLRPEIIPEKQGIVSHPDWAMASDHRPVRTTLMAENRD